jgi:catechol 2,3-dioxygenase-like lactoylglutathione lyase family enzyme
MSRPPARIRHIAIASKDPARAAEFFKNALGWKEIARRAATDDTKSGDHPGNRAITLTDGHINISLIRFSVDQIGRGADYEGLHHVGVVVNDVDAWTPKLEALGSPLIAGKDAIPSGAHFEIKFRGPDNVVFDISDRPWPGSAPVEAGELDADKDVPATAK